MGAVFVGKGVITVVSPFNYLAALGLVVSTSTLVPPLTLGFINASLCGLQALLSVLPS